jgi:hypothetical protein
MLSRNNGLTAATLLTGLAVAANIAHAEQAGASPNPAGNDRAVHWLGLPVLSVDGRLIGQVSEVKAGAGTGSPILIIRSQFEGQAFALPAALATHDGRAVKLNVAAQVIGKRA